MSFWGVPVSLLGCPPLTLLQVLPQLLTACLALSHVLSPRLAGCGIWGHRGIWGFGGDAGTLRDVGTPGALGTLRGFGDVEGMWGHWGH